MNNERNYVVGGVLALIILVGAIYFVASRNSDDRIAGTSNATSTASTSTPSTGGMILPYGRATISIDETARFRGISITPLSVVEDSRCAEGVQCIQAGTVRVNVRSTLDNSATRQDVIRLGSSATVSTFSVTLVSVEPAAEAGEEIDEDDYEFTFEVRQSAVIDNELIGK